MLCGLIDSSIKFTTKGQVILSVIDLNGRGSVEFKIDDTGVGIKRENLSRIIELFHQSDSSDTRSFGAIGLGLYLAKRYIDLLGGKTDVQSEVGKGSCFLITLPHVAEESVGRDSAEAWMARAT